MLSGNLCNQTSWNLQVTQTQIKRNKINSKIFCQGHDLVVSISSLMHGTRFSILCLLCHLPSPAFKMAYRPRNNLRSVLLFSCGVWSIYFPSEVTVPSHLAVECEAFCERQTPECEKQQRVSLVRLQANIAIFSVACLSALQSCVLFLLLFIRVMSLSDG